jgi:hypothetical protein
VESGLGRDEHLFLPPSCRHHIFSNLVLHFVFVKIAMPVIVPPLVPMVAKMCALLLLALSSSQCRASAGVLHTPCS